PASAVKVWVNAPLFATVATTSPLKTTSTSSPSPPVQVSGTRMRWAFSGNGVRASRLLGASPPITSASYEATSETPEAVLKPNTRANQVPDSGSGNEQVSLLPDSHGRHSQLDEVGISCGSTYRSASPVPPLIWNTRLRAPSGTASCQRLSSPVATLMSVTGTPFSSSGMSSSP